MAEWFDNVFKATKRKPEDDEISADELYNAGVDIPKGDPRLKRTEPMTVKDLYDHEKKTLLEYRKKP